MRPGCLRTATTKENIDRITHILKYWARLTVREIAQLSDLSVAGVHRIRIKYLNFKRKISAEWVPHLLQEDQRQARVKLAMVKQLLIMHPL